MGQSVSVLSGDWADRETNADGCHIVNVRTGRKRGQWHSEIRLQATTALTWRGRHGVQSASFHAKLYPDFGTVLDTERQTVKILPLSRAVESRQITRRSQPTSQERPNNIFRCMVQQVCHMNIKSGTWRLFHTSDTI